MYSLLLCDACQIQPEVLGILVQDKGEKMAKLRCPACGRIRFQPIPKWWVEEDVEEYADEEYAYKRKYEPTSMAKAFETAKRKNNK